MREDEQDTMFLSIITDSSDFNIHPKGRAYRLAIVNPVDIRITLLPPTEPGHVVLQGKTPHQG